MMQSEFEKMLGSKVTADEYRVIDLMLLTQK